VINARYLKSSTIITTNKPFKEWGEIFPNAACVVTLVDRLVHRSEIIKIDGASYRTKEALDDAEKRAQKKRGRPRKTEGSDDGEDSDPS